MAPQRKKARKDKKTDTEGLWIAPRYRLKGSTGERAWENRLGEVPNSGKYLELADIALGLKKPEHNKRPKAIEAHDTSKTEPYSKV